MERMPTGDTVTEGDEIEKPPAAKQVHGDDRGIQSWEKSSSVMPEVLVKEGEKKEPEADEFGLPVKPPRRRRDKDVSEDEYHGKINSTNRKTPLRKSSISHHIGQEEQAKEPSPVQSHTGERELSQAAMQDLGHGDNHTAIPSIPSIPNSNAVVAASGVSGWSHQALASRREEKDHRHEEEAWQDMPALAQYDLYDDDGRLIARQAHDSDEEANAYTGLGGAGKGYTRVQVDEDALSATSMDDDTNYLFKPKDGETIDDDDAQRDPLAQMQATKDLLTEGQRIAYVGVTRLAMATMVKELEDMEVTKATKKDLRLAVESTKMWSQQMMVRLYSHMDIDSSGKSKFNDL